MEILHNEEKIIGKILLKYYKIKEKIAEGSFGEVYIASNIQTKKKFAVKLVSKILTNIYNLFIYFFIGKKKRK
jgi:serine/threonine protein kinase